MLCDAMRCQVLVHEGEKLQGRQAIMQKLNSVAKLHAGFKVVHQVQHVDCQPLGVVRAWGCFLCL